MRIKAAYQLIEDLYPGLITLKANNGIYKLYLNDLSISKSTMRVSILTKSIRLMGDGFQLFMYLDNKNYINGVFRMDYDFGLSEKSCVWLYKYGITIYYIDTEGQRANVKYDREAIMRKHTINSIIN